MKKIIYFLMISLLLTSCEKEIGQLTDYEPSRLVVNALITAQSDNQSLWIRQTGVTQVQEVHDAEVTLSLNDVTIMQQTGTFADSIPVPAYKFHPGDVIKLAVCKDDMNATASTIVPNPVRITGIDTLTVKAKRYSYSTVYEPHTRYFVHLQLPENNIEEMQYFRVTIQKRIITPSSWQETDGVISNVTYKEDNDHILFGYWSDPALCETENADQENMSISFDWLEGMQNIYHLFRSTYFQDGQYTLRLDLPSPIVSHGWAQEVRIKVYTINRVEYNYLQAIAAMKTLDSGTLYDSEPGVTTNITGGAGIFSTSSVTEISFYEDHNLLKAK